MKNKENYKKACQIAIDNDQDLVCLLPSTDIYYDIFIASPPVWKDFDSSDGTPIINQGPSYTLKYLRQEQGMITPQGEEVFIYVIDSVEEHIW